MKTFMLFLPLLFLMRLNLPAEVPYPVKGLCIGAPSVEDVDEFAGFIENTLAPAGINTLVLRVDYNYKFKSHPELVGRNPLTKRDVKKLVAACKRSHIRLIPEIDLLGHQSWQSHVGKLLEVYPQFDETPKVEFPEHYTWPNPDGLYCKSYCPLNPDVHKVVFDLVDELMDVFEADAFHAGMDEVFYIGEEQCPRCSGRDKAELFAGEVTLIRNHLKSGGKELWIWGDRLIDGKTTGVGMWEGSYNNTYRAIDLIPKDVVICDWHYDRAYPTAPLFAAKGLTVITCPWQKSDVAIEQDKMTRSFIQNSSREMRPHFAGMMETVWGGTKTFMDSFNNTGNASHRDPAADCLKALINAWQ